MSDSDSDISEFTEVSNASQYDENILYAMPYCRAPIEEVLELCHGVPQKYNCPVEKLELKNNSTNKTYKLYVDRIDSDHKIDLKKYDNTVVRHACNLMTLTLQVANAISNMKPVNEYQTSTIYFDYNDKWRLGVIIEEQ
jgi:hypothetical protein